MALYQDNTFQQKPEPGQTPGYVPPSAGGGFNSDAFMDRLRKKRPQTSGSPSIRQETDGIWAQRQQPSATGAQLASPVNPDGTISPAQPQAAAAPAVQPGPVAPTPAPPANPQPVTTAQATPQATPAPAAPAPPPKQASTGYVDTNMRGTPEQALGGLTSWLQSNFGKAPSQQDLNEIAAAVQFQQGQQVSGTQYNKALDILAQKYNAQAQPQAATPAQPALTPPDPTKPSLKANFGRDPFATYSGYEFGNQDFTSYGGSPIDVALGQQYQGNQIGQFGGPNQGQTQGQLDALTQQLLSNPYSLNDDVVTKMKLAQNEQAAQLARQSQEQLGARAGARGTLGGGNTERGFRSIDESLSSSILGNNRALDIQKATQDREDLAGAMGLGSDMLTGQLGRSRDAYASQLAGQMSQAEVDQAKAASGLQRSGLDLNIQQAKGDDKYRASQSKQSAEQLGLQRGGMQADDIFRRYQSQFDSQQAGLDRDKTQADFDFRGLEGDRDFHIKQLNAQEQTKDRELRDFLGRQGLQLDEKKFEEAKNQFKQTFGLDLQQFLESQRQFNVGTSENARQFNSTQGLNYAQLGMQGQNQLMNWLQNSIK